MNGNTPHLTPSPDQVPHHPTDLVPSPAIQVPGLEHLSHSRIQSYMGCSLRWKFHYVDRLPAAFTPAALALGIAFHEAVEEGLAGMMVGTTPPVPDLVAIVERSLTEQEKDIPVQYADEGGKPAVIELSERMLTAWVNWKRPDCRILAVEHAFELILAENLPPLVGRIDLVEEHKDCLLVVDVKTSKNKWSPQQVEEHSSQLVLYREAVKTMAAELGKPIRLGWEIITKAKTPQVERIVVDQPEEAISRQVRIAQEVVRAIEASVFIPQTGWACASCPWAGPCREWGR